MEIAIIVPIRYPTEKAYGINISQTGQAFSKIGYNVGIYCNSTRETDELGNRLINVIPYGNAILKKMFSSKSKITNRLAFLLGQCFFSMKALKKIQKMYPDLIYTRFPIIAFILKKRFRPETKIICDLHHLPNRIEIAALNKLEDLQGFFLMVPNDNFKAQLESMGIDQPINLLPNAAPDAFFELKMDSPSPKNPMVVGYAGKAFSSGNNNGLDILSEIVDSKLDFGQVCRFVVVGCEPEFRAQLEKRMEKAGKTTLIEFFPHVSLQELTQHIKVFDIALIPYPETLYYERSSPLKMIEMAACGIPMVATRTRAHQRILGEDYPYFFEPGNYFQLFSALKEISQKNGQYKQVSENLRAWSQEFTYLRRAQAILEL
jgi:glycosyltransferase involved in cell wall biosynthesis